MRMIFSAAVFVSLAFAVFADDGNPFAGISFDVPKAWPCPELSGPGCRAIWIEGESWSGMPTRVFAYVVLPEGASANSKVPGVVLAHGGGGTAYLSWAQTWARHGYAAIVPDTCGALPVKIPEGRYCDWIRSGIGGPAGWGRCDLAFEKPRDQWPYHAVGALVRAHSHLRALPEVDAGKTGITGISWGGFLTVLTTAVDSRFKFAMPVYACGFYDEMPSYESRLNAWNNVSPDKVSRWNRLFDPKHYAPKMALPVMWFASTSDFAFPFDLLQRTVALPPDMPTLAIRVNMSHAHGPAGENMPELFMFADHVVCGGRPLPKVERPTFADGTVCVRFDAKGHALKRFDLNWCTNALPTKSSAWQVRAFPVPAGSVFTAPIPTDATRVYVNAVMSGETGETVYPEALVSSPACRVRR